MSFFNRVISKFAGGDALSSAEIAEISDCVNICSEETKHECLGDGELYAEEQKVWDTMKKDSESKLYGSSKASNLQIIIPTSVSDWKHDAMADSYEENTVPCQVSKFIRDYTGGGDFKISGNCSSLPIRDILDFEYMKLRKSDLLLLPYFLWVKGIKHDEIEAKFSAMVPVLKKYSESGEQQHPDKEKLITDLQKIHPDIHECNKNSVVLLCSHTTRDKRCGKTAPILKKIFESELTKYNSKSSDGSDSDSGSDNEDDEQDHEGHVYVANEQDPLNKNKVLIAFINHIGGHKFVANCQIYLQQRDRQDEAGKLEKLFLWFARISPVDVPLIVKNLIIPTIEHRDLQLDEPKKIRCVKKYKW